MTASQRLDRYSVILLTGRDDYADLQSLKRIPIFYSGEPDTEMELKVLGAMAAIGTIFGSVHFLAGTTAVVAPWMPYVWMYAAIGMTTAPLLIPLCQVILLVFVYYVGGFLCHIVLADGKKEDWEEAIVANLLLKSLPPDVLKIVPWTTFLLYVGS
ncbi:SubName: Full=Uncharacterized protein {ECO:0000313/EMBL:CCA70997.1} [Serendipita indica DSM 11827]|nr:SubName: Full=Uncharacterized protein {ECO:0000313/EMBL:CCA70997.1} [Serendipita indica DSM 11827]